MKPSRLELPRRGLLAGTLSGLALDALGSRAEPLRGAIVGASHERGHLLRRLPELGAGSARDVEVAVVGGGVAGLGAAWRLAAGGIQAEVLELEPRLGGTSAYGDDGAVPYPWGAHYLAAPNPEATAPLRLLADMGTLVGWDAAGRPRFDPKVLCHGPQERLFVREGGGRGEWLEGLSPVDAMTDPEEEELQRFHGLEDELSRKRGRDGRPAFAIPLHLSSRDPELLALDRLSFAEHLERLGFRTPFVRWYLRYATLDDFGAEPEQTSAWAGLHYFASRKLKTAELAGSHFLVWPEGNGRLVRELRERSAAAAQTDALAIRVERRDGRVHVHYLVPPFDAVHTLRARAVVLAVPAFVASRLAPAFAARFPARTSSPWLVANLHVTLPNDPNRAWDSVLRDGEGLGYVDAGHQRTRPEPRTVLTYYRAFGGADPAGDRARLLETPWMRFCEAILLDLAPAHPDLGYFLERLDVMRWGHAMPRPVPGFLGDLSAIEPRLGEGLVWAHSDQTGMALFEEALTRGVLAAEAILQDFGDDPEPWA